MHHTKDTKDDHLRKKETHEPPTMITEVVEVLEDGGEEEGYSQEASDQINDQKHGSSHRREEEEPHEGGELEHLKERETKEDRLDQETETEHLQREGIEEDSENASKYSSKKGHREASEENEGEDEDIKLEVHDTSILKSKRHVDIEEDDDDSEEEQKTVKSIFGKRESEKRAISPEISVHRSPGSSKRKLFVWALGLFIMAVTIGIGLMFFNRSSEGGSLPGILAQASPTSTPTVNPSPTPTPQPVDKKELSIQILNGSGEPGVASRMKAFLEKGGYTVNDTGNAETFTYEKTEISVKKKFDSILGDLKGYLEDKYAIGKAQSDLPDSSEYDVRIIVGTE